MRRLDMAGKISFLRRMRKTTGYAGRYLFPVRSQPDFLPFSPLSLSHLFPLLLIPSSLFFARSAAFTFIRQQAFLPALSQAFSCPSSFRPLRSAFPPLIFCLTFSPPHRIPPACTIFAFPLFFSFPCPCQLFTAPPSPAVISPLLRSPPSAAFPPLPLSSCDTKNLIFV